MVREAEQSGNIRDAQRLRRCAQPHASGFITAMPSQHDGFDTVLRPKTFRTAVRYRLGIPILLKEISCPLCMQTIDVYGDHATCCSKAGDLIVRHNAMRNLVNEIAEDGKLSPVLEKKGILGDANGRRPGDVCSRGVGLGRRRPEGGLPSLSSAKQSTLRPREWASRSWGPLPSLAAPGIRRRCLYPLASPVVAKRAFSE